MSPNIPELIKRIRACVGLLIWVLNYFDQLLARLACFWREVARSRRRPGS